jgi:hypothetical protein
MLIGLGGLVEFERELTRTRHRADRTRCLVPALAGADMTDVQQRLALLSREMENHNGQRIPHQPALSRS